MRVRHPRIKQAAKLPLVTVLCCHEARPGLMEKDVERGVVEALESAGWYVIRVAAEAGKGSGKARKRDPRAATPGTLDLVAYESASYPPHGLHGPPRPWLIEVKNGDRDLTPEQLATIEAAPKYGLRCMVVDEASLLTEWLKGRT